MTQTKRKRRRRTPPVKNVKCHVRVLVSGRTVKTVRRRITMAQALREIGSDPVGTEGRLLTGVPFNRKRSIVRGVSVVLMYVADTKPQPQTMPTLAKLADVVGVVRAGMRSMTTRP